MDSEISDNYFHDGFNHGPGGTDNQLNLAYWSSNNLIVNNIFWRQHVAIMIERGPSGNVIAYNYITGNYHTAGTEEWEVIDIDWHGTHPMFNLLEGNEDDTLVADDFWGSSSNETIFRHYATGVREFIPPRDAPGTLVPGTGTRPSCIGTNSSGCWEDGFSSSSGNTFGIDINAESTSFNLVGVITGSTHMVSTDGAAPLKISPQSNFGNFVCQRIGYDGSNDAVGPGVSAPAIFANNLANTSSFQHGYNNCSTGAITWAAGVTHTLPPSFFLASEPNWWGSRPWPGIGPDVTGGTGWQSFVNNNPAADCFNTTTSNGTSNTRAFNPDSCYPTSVSSPTPAPSSGFIITL